MQRVVKRLFEQSDNHWQLFIVDDASTYEPAVDYLQHLQRACPEHIQLQCLPTQMGPGACRNLGIRMAEREGCPVVMFCDSDDLVHRERVQITRRHFSEAVTPTVLYSSFTAVDGHGFKVPMHKVTPSLLEILEATRPVAPQGHDVWKQIATQTGYLNLTSSTSVSMNTALRHPFPLESVSEDSHTWMRYSASGARFVFDPTIPVSYRVKVGAGSASRERDAGLFYAEKVRVDTDGFNIALQMGVASGSVQGHTESNHLRAMFQLRLAATMAREQQQQLAIDALDLACQSQMETTLAGIKQFPELLSLLGLVQSMNRAA